MVSEQDFADTVCKILNVALLSGSRADSKELAGFAGNFPLPWSAYVRLLSVKNSEARAFYENEALRLGWSIRQLDRQISTQFYERIGLSRNKAAMLKKAAPPAPGDSVTPEEAIQDPFVLEFLGLKERIFRVGFGSSADPPSHGPSLRDGR